LRSGTRLPDSLDLGTELPVEAAMAHYPPARRDVLKLSAWAAAAVPLFGSVRGTAASSAPAYDPAASFELDVTEVEMRRNRAGRMLMARVYRPKGSGPFPVVLDLHGGAWNNKNRTAEEPMDRAIAASGVLVVAIDLTLAPEAPYPASVQDANYGVRWLKSKAADWNGDASRLGIYGSSSGGHVAQLLALRPGDPRYNAIPLTGVPPRDANLAYVAMRSPISDPVARYQNAERRKREGMIASHKTYFVPWETIHEASPQAILERKEKVTLVPMLLMQGALDDNVLPAVQEKFAATYRAAGGHCQLEIFADSEHEWVAKPGPQTDRARAMVKAFIAEQLRRT
jgi:acetyl esterase